MINKQLGMEFRWFIGKVEDNNDPEQLGRIKIRLFNMTDENDISTDDLMWAYPLMPCTSASFNGLGLSPTGIEVGSIGMGFFADGNEGNYPVLMGTYYTKPDHDDDKNNVSKLARNKNIISKQLLGPEPKSAYDSKYPYNKTVTTKSGHVVEIDDTPGHERIHVYHKSGSYIEINEKGRVVKKTIDDDFEIVAGNQTIYIKGDADITVKGKMTINNDINVKGKITVSDDVIADGISLVNHKHSGVDTGSGNSGPPV